MNSPRPALDTQRARLLNHARTSGGAVIAASIVIPVAVWGWTPNWFPIAWTVLYVCQSAFFISSLSRNPLPRRSQQWAIFTAALFCMVPVAVLVWGVDHPSAPWIGATISIGYIAFEVAALPYLNIPAWWTGTAMVGIAMTVMAAVAVHPLFGIALTPLVITMILVSGRNKTMSDDLDKRLTEAEAMLGTDPLTNLLNRRGLEAELNELDGQEVTIAIFDADRFKQINDSQGHGVGDQVLVAIANHLTSTLSSPWIIARHGGDEFIAVSPGLVELDEAAVMPLHMDRGKRHGQINFTISAGVASGRLSASGDRLLSEAGHALRQAKRDGSRLVPSTGELRERFERSVSITTLEQTTSPIIPVAQVIVDELGVVGCELLARWQLPDGTLLSPAQFMDMLTENGLLGQLDNVMLEHAVLTAARFAESNIDMFVSANIAASHLLDSELPGRVRQLLTTHNVSPSQLMIEVTESERLGKDRLWESAVHGLRDLGVMLAIDDFGAGYSSVARLRHLPITHLKLDMSMVQGEPGPLLEIVRGVTKFCQQSDIGVIAEGIETEAEHAAMREAGVDLCQGYLFGRPMRLDDLVRDVTGRTANPAPDELKLPDEALGH